MKMMKIPQDLRNSEEDSSWNEEGMQNPICQLENSQKICIYKMNQEKNWIPRFKDNVDNGTYIPKHTRNVGHHESTKLRWGRF